MAKKKNLKYAKDLNRHLSKTNKQTQMASQHERCSDN